MLNPGKILGRALIGSLFVYGGQNAIKNSAHLVPMIDAARERYGLKDSVPVNSQQLIQANGAGMVALGSTMALGIKPRLSALGLLGMLGATTVAAHNFWDMEDPQARNQHMTSFFGNLAAAGGLITVASTSK